MHVAHHSPTTTTNTNYIHVHTTADFEAHKRASYFSISKVYGSATSNYSDSMSKSFYLFDDLRGVSCECLDFRLFILKTCANRRRFFSYFNTSFDMDFLFCFFCFCILFFFRVFYVRHADSFVIHSMSSCLRVESKWKTRCEIRVWLYSLYAAHGIPLKWCAPPAIPSSAWSHMRASNGKNNSSSNGISRKWKINILKKKN